MIPEISVLMSVYNGGQYLHEAIESILCQSFKNFEFIIVNDGSTDNSYEIIKSYGDARIKIINQINSGLPIALNKGLEIACGKYIARIDADDVSMPSRLEMQYEFLENNNDYVIVGSNARIVDKDGDYVWTPELPLSDSEIRSSFPSCPFISSSVMFRKEIAIKAGRYYEEISKLYQFEDVLLWNEMLKYGKGANINKDLIKYRLVPGAATTKSGKENGIVETIKEDILKRGFITDSEKQQLLKIRQSSNNKQYKESIYYFHLSKKFLWNNYQPALARKNAIKAIRLNPFQLSGFLLFFTSFVPHEIIRKIYKYYKN